MRTVAMLVLVGSAVVATSICCPPALAGGTVTIDNQSASTIKVAAPGGSAIVDASSDPVEVGFDNEEKVGVDLAVWWVSKPRELCQIFVPWERTVIVTGKSTIRCRSR